jgi:hypothetical protein
MGLGWQWIQAVVQSQTLAGRGRRPRGRTAVTVLVWTVHEWMSWCTAGGRSPKREEVSAGRTGRRGRGVPPRLAWPHRPRDMGGKEPGEVERKQVRGCAEACGLPGGTADARSSRSAHALCRPLWTPPLLPSHAAPAALLLPRLRPAWFTCPPPPGLYVVTVNPPSLGSNVASPPPKSPPLPIAQPRVRVHCYRVSRFIIYPQPTRQRALLGPCSVPPGKADAIFLARVMLRDPQWPLHAARELGYANARCPPQYARAF